MQDENTTQTTDNNSTGIGEDTLHLGSNPSSPQDPAASDTSTSDTPTDSPAAPAIIEPEQTEDTASPAPTGPTNDLESIKSSVLEELMPIVSQLDQGPEDKYRTLMMLIQSSDNQSLVKDAYEAAHQIEDPKAKAEALLNIVNEINYFTGKAAGNSEAEPSE